MLGHVMFCILHLFRCSVSYLQFISPFTLQLALIVHFLLWLPVDKVQLSVVFDQISNFAAVARIIRDTLLYCPIQWYDMLSCRQCNHTNRYYQTGDETPYN